MRKRQMTSEIRGISMILWCCILLYRRLNRLHSTIAEPSQFFLVTAAIINTRANICPFRIISPSFNQFRIFAFVIPPAGFACDAGCHIAQSITPLTAAYGLRFFVLEQHLKGNAKLY